MDSSRERPWRVDFSPAAIKALDRLTAKIDAAVVEFCTYTSPQNPHRTTRPLRYELEGWHVARRADYRVILQIIDNDQVLLIGRI